jgi:hydrogenase nickel incorporation protein HypA/HybF
MHEMGLATEVVEQVSRRLARRAPTGVRVAAVRMQIGRLSGYAPESVRAGFDLAAAGTPLEGARLDVEEPAGRAECRACGRVSDVPDALTARCAHCGATDLDIRDGQQLRVVGVELA